MVKISSALCCRQKCKRPQMHQDRRQKTLFVFVSKLWLQKETYACHLSFMNQESRRGHQKRHAMAQKRCRWQKKAEAEATSPAASLHRQLHLQGTRVAAAEFLQQLKRSISIRKPFLLRAAFGDELEQQPAICFLRQNNNGASLSHGNRLETMQVHPTSTVWGQKTIV